MPRLQALARQAAFDALTLIGPGEDCGFVRTTDPEVYLTGQRLALAREALAAAGKDRDVIELDELADRFLPRLREMILSGRVK
jgi:hypothetical protein